MSHPPAPILHPDPTQVWPAVAPYDATNPANPILLEQRLTALRSDDSNVRVNAFNGLRAMPKEMVSTAWSRLRWKEAPHGFDNDCLHRTWVQHPAQPLTGKRAFVTVISHGYEPMLRALLDSLTLRGNCPDVPFIVFCVGDEAFATVSSWSDAIPVLCLAHERVSPAIKSIIYSCSRWLSFQSIVSLEADMLVVADMNPLFETIERGHPQNFYGCRSQVKPERYVLRQVLRHMNAPESDLEWMTGRADIDSPFFFNGGLLAGSWMAWKGLDAGFEALNPFVSIWVEGAFHHSFTDEFAMNLVAGLGPQFVQAVELSPTFNVQIIDTGVAHWVQETANEDGSSRFARLGEPAHVLHFMKEKWRLFDTLPRLRPVSPAETDTAQPPIELECRRCGEVGALGQKWASHTIAVELNSNGRYSALCQECASQRRPHRAAPKTAENKRQCEECGHVQGPCSCWVTGSITGERFPNGHLKALCKDCAKKRGESSEPLYELAVELGGAQA